MAFSQNVKWLFLVISQISNLKTASNIISGFTLASSTLDAFIAYKAGNTVHVSGTLKAGIANNTTIITPISAYIPISAQLNPFMYLGSVFRNSVLIGSLMYYDGSFVYYGDTTAVQGFFGFTYTIA